MAAGRRQFPPPHPAPILPSAIPAARHIPPYLPTHAVIPAPHIVILAPPRHSRESGNPHPGLSAQRHQPGFWIPAYAGMTDGRNSAVSICHHSCPPSYRHTRPPTPAHPPPPRHSRPPPVIPAKAGIHTYPSARQGRPGFWIPAYAGMTDGADSAVSIMSPLTPAIPRHSHPTPVVPALTRHSRPTPVIPAKAGIHPPPYQHSGVNRGSGFRPTPE